MGNPKIYARFLQIEFLSYYGNEHYCPLSSLRVFGRTMLEEAKDWDMEHPEYHLDDAVDEAPGSTHFAVSDYYARARDGALKAIRAPWDALLNIWHGEQEQQPTGISRDPTPLTARDAVAHPAQVESVDPSGLSEVTVPLEESAQPPARHPKTHLPAFGLSDNGTLRQWLPTFLKGKSSAPPSVPPAPHEGDVPSTADVPIVPSSPLPDVQESVIRNILRRLQGLERNFTLQEQSLDHTTLQLALALQELDRQVWDTNDALSSKCDEDRWDSWRLSFERRWQKFVRAQVISHAHITRTSSKTLPISLLKPRWMTFRSLSLARSRSFDNRCQHSMCR